MSGCDDSKEVLDRIIMTCFTLAAMHNVKGDVTLLAMKLLTFKEKDNIPDNNTTCVDGRTDGQQRRDEARKLRNKHKNCIQIHLRSSTLSKFHPSGGYIWNFSCKNRYQADLKERQWAHLRQQIDRVKLNLKRKSVNGMPKRLIKPFRLLLDLRSEVLQIPQPLKQREIHIRKYRRLRWQWSSCPRKTRKQHLLLLGELQISVSNYTIFQTTTC